MVFPHYSFFQTLSWKMETGEDVVAKVSITACLVMNALEFLCFMVIFYDMHKEQTEKEREACLFNIKHIYKFMMFFGLDILLNPAMPHYTTIPTELQSKGYHEKWHTGSLRQRRMVSAASCVIRNVSSSNTAH